MFAIMTSLGLAALTALSPQRLYYQVNRPFVIAVSSGTAREVVLMTPANDELKRISIPDDAATVDLQETIPTIWDLSGTHYVQQLTDGQPDGPALVLQPLVTPPTPVLRYQTRNGQQYPQVERWQEPSKDDQVMSGFRVYVEQNPVLHTTMGDIVFMLRPDEAPNTAWNFRDLVASGFYTDIPFHRIVAKAGNGYPFVIQGGDPSATGSGGCSYNIDLENTKLPHDLGVISMAREGRDVNTAGSQFFICLSREGTQALDGQYAAFGQTIEGIDVVQALGDVPVGPNDRPVNMPYVTTAELVDAAPRMPGQRPDWMPQPAPVTKDDTPEPKTDVDPGR